jgi:hypothetical protein
MAKACKFCIWAESTKNNCAPLVDHYVMFMVVMPKYQPLANSQQFVRDELQGELQTHMSQSSLLISKIHSSRLHEGLYLYLSPELPLISCPWGNDDSGVP